MIIDSHHHFWKYNAEEYGWIDDSMQRLQRDFLPSHLEEELTANKVDGVVTVQARQSLEETRWLLSLADKHAFIKGVVGWVDLCSTDVEKQLAEFVTHKKFVGVRHVLQGEADDRFMLRKDFQAGLRLLHRYNLTYDLLIHPRHLRIAAELVAAFPQQRFVIDHMAKPFIKAGDMEPWRADMKVLGTFKNVWCKVSGLVTEADWQAWRPDDFQSYLNVVEEAFGYNRLMVGSDWPVCLVAATYQRAIDSYQSYFKDRSDEVRSKIVRDNCAAFYNLE